MTSWKTSYLRLNRERVNTVKPYHEQELRHKGIPHLQYHRPGRGPGGPAGPGVRPAWGGGRVLGCTCVLR